MQLCGDQDITWMKIFLEAVRIRVLICLIIMYCRAMNAAQNQDDIADL